MDSTIAQQPRRKRANTMIEQLSVFTSEVPRVAREVGTEGRLGVQARVWLHR